MLEPTVLDDRPAALGPLPPPDLDAYLRAFAATDVDADGQLAEVLSCLGHAIVTLADHIGRGPLDGTQAWTDTINVQGETQTALDVISNELFVNRMQHGSPIAGLVSEELDGVHTMPRLDRHGRYLLAIDPLDGSSNIAVNVPVGTIFSVLRMNSTGSPTEADFLQPGRDQVCAGFALYGPATVLVLATPGRTVGFTLDRRRGVFVLTNPDMRIPDTAREFAINSSNERFWAPPVRRFVAECLAGSGGPRGADYNMRWIASLVAETYRILTRGGIFLYPGDTRSGTRSGKLRLLYECNPIAFVVEQAGGSASTGDGRVLDVAPTGLHQRVPLLFGSRTEVELIDRYHRDARAGLGADFSLFNSRTLFRAL